MNAFRAILLTLAASIAFFGNTVTGQTLTLKFKVGSTDREAMVVSPAAANASGRPPLIFLFHPHGATAQSMLDRLDIAAALPEAVVVSMQGLPTPGMSGDPEGKQSGWQFTQGQSDDRDLKFFNAILPVLEEKFHVDHKRVYAVGYSNGGFFAYLLWAERPDVLTAVVAGGCKLLPEIKLAKPMPALHFASKDDMRVLVREQEETIDTLRKLNGCSDPGGAGENDTILYRSEKGTPVSAFVDSSGNAYSDGAVKATIAFLKERIAQP